MNGGSGGVLRPQSDRNFDIACTLNEKRDIHPFAYRVHAHQHGKKYFFTHYGRKKNKKIFLGVWIGGYVYNNGNWTLIGKQSPQLPQAFYPVAGTPVIKPGDTIVTKFWVEFLVEFLFHKFFECRPPDVTWTIAAIVKSISGK